MSLTMQNQSVRRGPSILQHGSGILLNPLLNIVVAYVDGGDADKLEELLKNQTSHRLEVNMDSCQIHITWAPNSLDFRQVVYRSIIIGCTEDECKNCVRGFSFEQMLPDAHDRIPNRRWESFFGTWTDLTQPKWRGRPAQHSHVIVHAAAYKEGILNLLSQY